MSDSVRLNVTATDNASDDFQRIGQNAARMGQQITQAGKSAGQGLKQVGTDAAQLNKVLDQIEQNTRQTAQGLDKLAQSANKADDGVKKSRASMAAMGAAATTLAGFLSDAARAAAEEEAIFAQLEAAVDATGESFDEYAGQIDQAIAKAEALSFADDAAASGLTKLTTITQDTGEAIDLMGLAMDVARGRGISLAEAATLVGRAAEGQTTALTRMGIVLQEGATAQDALAALQQRYAGQAEAYANTTAGAYDRVKNTIDNFVESIGSGTGDLQLLLTLMPGISAGYTLIGGAAGLAVSGIQKLRAASALATVALGPVGLALAATSAVVAIGSMTDWFGLAADGASDYEEAVKSAQEATKLLDDTIYSLRTDSESFLNAQEIQAQLREVTTALGIYSDRYEEFVKFRDDHPGWTDEEIRQQWGILRGEDMLPRLDRLGATGEQIERIATVTNDLVGRFDDAGVNTRLLATDLDGLFDSFQSGEINAQQFVAELDRMQSGFNDTYVTIDHATAALTRYEQVQRRLAGPNRPGIVNPMDELGGLPDATAQAERNAAIRENIRLISDQGDAMASIKADATAYNQTLHETNQALIDYVANGGNIINILQAMAVAHADATLASIEHTDAGREELAMMLEYRAAGQGLVDISYGWLDTAESALYAKNVLDQSFQTIIGGSESLAQSGQQVADWASGLTGITFNDVTLEFTNAMAEVEAAFARGELTWEEYSEAVVDAQSDMYKALQTGRLSLQDYDAAQVATQDILWNNAMIQQDVAAIMAKQLPIMADRTNAYQDQVAAIASMNAEEARHTLLMMDAGVQTQVATAYSTAYAASLGEIPKDVASEIILAEAAANPDIKAIYEDLGLISEGADGTITVNFPEGESMTATLGTLNERLEDLIAVIAEVNGITIAPKIDQGALDALLAIGKYNKGGPILGDSTGGAYGTSSPPGQSVQGGEQPPKTQTVTITANAEPYFRVSSDVQANAALLAGTETQLLVSADGTQAISVFRDIEGAVVAISDGEHIISVTGDTADATNDIALVNEALNAINGTQGVVYVLGDESNATAAINTTHANRDGVDGTSGTIYIYGDPSGAVDASNTGIGAAYAADGASGTIYIYGDASGARAAFDSVNGLVGTSVINIIPNIVGDMTPGFRDGGVVGYDAAALDGIVTHGGYRNVMVGEAGREILRVPPGSSVTPAPMTNALTGGSSGGKEVHLHFHNAVYGMDDFQQQVAQGVRSAMYQGQYQ
jgi:hypothetical protein